MCGSIDPRISLFAVIFIDILRRNYNIEETREILYYGVIYRLIRVVVVVELGD